MINVYNNEILAFSVVHNFISIEECEEMLAHSWQNLESADVISNDGKGQKHEGRTGSNTWLEHNASPLIETVAERISQMVRMP